MDKFFCTKDGELGQFKDKVFRNERYAVLRNVMGECVLLREEDKPNIIAKEDELLKIGSLTGTPSLGGM